jgi:hypothetical protein
MTEQVASSSFGTPTNLLIRVPSFTIIGRSQLAHVKSSVQLP